MIEGESIMLDRQTGYPSIDKPWLKYYSKEAVDASLPECTIYEYLIANNKDYPSDIAILYVGRKITYKQLFDCIDQTAAALTALGVKPGEIVTVALPSIPEALYTVYALNKIGAVANMIHPLAGEQEMVNYLNEAESRVAVLYQGSYDIVKNRLQNTAVKHAVVVSAGESLPLGIKQLFLLKTPRPRLPAGAGLQSWPAFIRGGQGVKVSTFAKDPRTLALISHTGGTTGEPKGVMCSDYSVNALIWQVGQTLPSNRQERMLVVLPPFINYSLVNGMFEPLSLGHQIVLIPNYVPEQFAAYVKEYKPNHINSIPAYLETLLRSENAKNVDYSCFRHVYYGGEAMAPETEQEINELILARGAENKLGKGLGSTEMVSSATLTVPKCNLSGSVGIPFVKVNCKIVEPDTTEELTYGQIGEICFTGPTLMMGYYNKPEATDAIVKYHADGQRWLHTGDLGYLDENGVLYVTGRIKRILMTKGRDGNITKIFPDRIEKTVSEHEAVAVCCAIGVPDEKRINRPVVYVVCKPGAGEQAQITEQIVALCRKELPDYMVPEAVLYREDLPRTPRGKIDYRQLEKMALE